MRILTNAGNDRVIDQLRAWLTSGAATVDLMSPDFSLHAFAEAREMLKKVDSVRLLLGKDAMQGQSFFGGLPIFPIATNFRGGGSQGTPMTG